MGVCHRARADHRPVPAHHIVDDVRAHVRDGHTAACFPSRDLGPVPVRGDAGRAVHHQEPGARERRPGDLRIRAYCGQRGRLGVESAHNGRMTTLTGEQAKLILNTVGLPGLKAEHPVTERVIAAIPPDKIDYRPDDIVKSAIDLAWHIVSAENRFLEAVINGTFDLSPAPRPDSIRTAAAVNDWYAPRFEKNLERI